MKNSEKMTNRKALAYVLDTYDIPAEVAEKLNGMIAQLDKRTGAERKPSARQVENESVKEKILNHMEQNMLYTITDMLKTFELGEDMSSQRVSALLTQLIADGKVVRTTDKRKVYFSLAE